MKNIYINTGDVSGKLLNDTIEQMEIAKDKLGYNFSADSYLEVAIAAAKYTAPTGVHKLYNSDFAEKIENLHSRVAVTFEKLQAFKKILDSGPDELVDIDNKQKNEMSDFWTRASYYLINPNSFFKNIFGIGTSDPVFVLPEFTNYNREKIINKYNWDMVLITEEELKQTALECNYEAELIEKLEQLQNSERNIKFWMEKTIAEDLGKDGDKYWDWYYGEDKDRTDSYCALFAAYHIAHAGIDMDTPSKTYDVNVKTFPPAQMGYFQHQNSFHPKDSDYIPKTGDVLFVDWDGGSVPAHVGMIYVGNDGQTYVLHGNNDKGQVALTKYSEYWQKVTVGFGSIQELYASQ